MLTRGRLDIALFGDLDCYRQYKDFTARHPKLPFFRKKTIGVALRDLDGRFDELFTGGRFHLLRREVSRARRAGYKVTHLDPASHLDAIMQVNMSMASRQGRAMDPAYLDRDAVVDYCGRRGQWYGVFDADAVLRAYCHLSLVGDCCLYSRVLGDPRHGRYGIMYLLFQHTMEAMHRLRTAQGHPRWLMYDMFLGCGDGLRQFKRHLGFVPERVHWSWLPAALPN